LQPNWRWTLRRPLPPNLSLIRKCRAVAFNPWHLPLLVRKRRGWNGGS